MQGAMKGNHLDPYEHFVVRAPPSMEAGVLAGEFALSFRIMCQNGGCHLVQWHQNGAFPSAPLV